jgi:HD superfamily phosphohydrolase
VSNPHRTYEIRCPVHGFIPFNDWEREIINHPAFQRLRRIRQLALTDYVYPGAMHTRFEHSLGVMHIASQLFDAVVQRSPDRLEAEIGFTATDLERDRQIVRFTALLHDTGHGPFSHAAEDIFPKDAVSGRHYKHEAYSATIIQHVLKEAIEDHPLNEKLGIKVEEITTLLEGKAAAGRRLFWRQLIDGQMDADRMDYLLRDSLHTGVDYGKYDWRRLLNTIQIIEMPPREEEETPLGARLGVTEGGVHAAEALVLARYYMFTQVYFHKTRVAYDHHIRQALKAILPNGTFPPPTPEGIADYLPWNDWRILGLLADGQSGGEHGDRLRERNHYREVYHTPECPTEGDRTALALIRNSLGDLVVAVESSKTSTYKLEASDIPVVTEDDLRRVRPLSHFSSVVRNLTQHALEIIRIYSSPKQASAARARVVELLKEAP